ncbi:ABC transporter permease [Longimicrobium sp.]|uniref:ABC transporter permease n=1 Tax=Longimicrobium sp. TaxID=2029185 RepID=UPI003B3B0CAE
MALLPPPVARAARRLLRSPLFAGTAVLTLALGIGAATAILALVDAVLLRPLPYADAGRLVELRHVAPGFEITDGGQSDATFLHYQQGNRVFSEMGAYLENRVTLTDTEQPERVHVALATPGVFGALRVRPLHGRALTAADGEPGATPVVLVSHGLWKRRYGGDPGLVGRTVEVNRSQREVVGILPPDFAFPRRETELYVSMGVEPAGAGVRDLYLSAVARLRDGVTVDQAGDDLRRLAGTLPEAYPDAPAPVLAQAGFQPRVTPLKERMVGAVRPALVILACAVGFLLLVALANVANLFLVRTAGRSREVAVERALGATDRDLARGFMSESLLLALTGGVLGLVLAAGAVRARFGFGAGQVPRLDEVRLGGAALGVGVALAVLSGVAFGAVSLARSARTAPGEGLKGGGGRATGGRGWHAAQRFLVAMQVALALALLIGSAVMVQSLRALRQVDLGFGARQVVAAEVSLPNRQYRGYGEASRFYAQVLERLRAHPGVTSAEATFTLPLTQTLASFSGGVEVQGKPPRPGEVRPSVAYNLATPGYFEALRIPLLRGRGFRSGDLAGGAPAVVVSEALARGLLGGEDPLGRRVRLDDGQEGAEDGAWYTIVGVVGNVAGENVAAGPARTLYLPVLADPLGEGTAPTLVPRDLTVVVRSSLPAASVADAVRGAVREVDAKVPVANVRALDEVVAAATARSRLTTLLLLVAAGTAVFLGVLGIYGVVSYSVSQRMPEFGVRLALGATPAQLNRLVLRQGAVMAGAGVVAGVVAAFAVTRLLRGLLYQVSPSDPLAFGAMSVLLFSVAVAASWLPARRAGGTDPLRALRAE